MSGRAAPPPSVLAVYAHPDDESLVAGGILARHAAAGARTAVVTATWAADSHRARELTDALRILGAGTPRMLGYADLHVPASAPGRPRFRDAPLAETVERVVAHVRDFRPDVIVFPVKFLCSVSCAADVSAGTPQGLLRTQPEQALYAVVVAGPLAGGISVGERSLAR